ncbi:MAG: cytochrome c biogenesis protein ResB [Halanaerobiaceae bacterium]
MKNFKIIYSMKTALFLLILIALVSVVGTIIPQGNSQIWYQENYSTFIFHLIDIFKLDNIYHSLCFLGLFGLLSLNLIGCSISRLGSLIKKMRKPYFQGNKILTVSEDIQIIKSRLQEMGYKKIYFVKSESLLDDKQTKKTEAKSNDNQAKKSEKPDMIYASRAKPGFLGSWLTHLGFLLIIIFYCIGLIFGTSILISIVPGDLKELDELDFAIRLDDFQIDYREDYSIDQYYSHVQVFSENNRIDHTISVNNPLSFNGYGIYQLATGWAANIQLLIEDEFIKEFSLLEGEMYDLRDKLQLRFLKFLPDPVFIHGSLRNRSPLPVSPHLIYQIWEGEQLVDMGLIKMGEKKSWHNIGFYFTQPQRYTSLEVKKDPGIKGVFLGGIILLIGMIFSFYINPRSVVVRADQQGNSSIYLYCYKNSLQEEEKLRREIIGGEDQ